MELIYISLASVHIVFSLVVSLRIRKSKTFTRERKRINTVLVWVIPYLWGLLVLFMLSPEKNSKGKKHSPRQRYMDGGYSGYTAGE